MWISSSQYSVLSDSTSRRVKNELSNTRLFSGMWHSSFHSYIHTYTARWELCCVSRRRPSLHVINVFHWTGVFIYNTLQSMHHGRNVTKSFVKDILCQHCHLKEMCREQRKNSVKQVQCWTETKYKTVTFQIKVHVKILSLQGNKSFKIMST